MKLSEIVEAIKSDKLEMDINLETTGVFIGVAKVIGSQTVNFTGTAKGDGKLIAVMLSNLMLRNEEFREAVQKATELYFKLRKERKDEE